MVEVFGREGRHRKKKRKFGNLEKWKAEMLKAEGRKSGNLEIREG
jgi:hypothetical protein